MNERIKNLWIAALRSGKYKQGPGYLQSLSGKFCCLGVLCDIMDPNGWKETNSTYIDHRPGEDSEAGRGSAIPAKSIIAEAGIPAMVEHGYPEVGDSYDTIEILTDMNDDRGLTFDEIADWIEKNL